MQKSLSDRARGAVAMATDGCGVVLCRAMLVETKTCCNRGLPVLSVFSQRLEPVQRGARVQSKASKKNTVEHRKNKGHNKRTGELLRAPLPIQLPNEETTIAATLSNFSDPRSVWLKGAPCVSSIRAAVRR